MVSWILLDEKTERKIVVIKKTLLNKQKLINFL